MGQTLFLVASFGTMREAQIPGALTPYSFMPEMEGS